MGNIILMDTCEGVVLDNDVDRNSVVKKGVRMSQFMFRVYGIKVIAGMREERKST